MNHRPLLALLFGLIVAARPALKSTQSVPIDLAAALEPFRTESNIPGMVALVLRGDHIIAEGAVGVRKQGASDPIKLGDQVHIGSCTKAMTATVAARLVEEGKLQWTVTLEQLFGDWGIAPSDARRDLFARMGARHQGALGIS